MMNSNSNARLVTAALLMLAATLAPGPVASAQDQLPPRPDTMAVELPPVADQTGKHDSVEFAEPDWYTSLNEAQQRASTTERQILYFVYTDWCRWCQAMRDSVVGTPAVDSLRSRLVFAEVNGDIDTATVSRLRVQGYPTFLILDKTGNEVDRVMGYHSAHALSRWCDDALKGNGTMWTLARDHREKKDDSKVMFALAQKHLSRGQYVEATNFFENIINQDLGNTSGKVDSSMFEVALIHRRNRDWYKAVEQLKDLLKQYPETALKEEANLYIPWLLSRAGDREEAIKLYKSFLEKHSGSSETNWVQDQIEWLESGDEGKS